MPAISFKKEICPSTIKTMVAIKDGTNILSLSLKTKYMYSHTINLLKILKAKGLIFTNKKGRTVIIQLTQKGEEFQHNCKKIVELWKTK